MAERRSWVRIHRALGLFLGAWFALVGLTGAILVYEDAVDAWLNPSLLTEASPGRPLPPERILEAADLAFPLSHVERIRLPASSGEVYRLQVRVAPHLRSGSPRVEAMFGPATGRLLGTRELGELGVTRPYLLKTLYEFHRNVLLGPAGSNIVGVAGLLLLLSAVSGFAMAMPRNRSGWKRVVGVKLRASGTRILFDIHRSWGTLAAALLVLATVTGTTLVWLNYARDIVNVFSPVAPFPVVPWRESPQDNWPSFESVLARVRDAHPRQRVVEVHLPSKPTAGYLFYLRGAGDVHRLGDTIVWVHPGTGETLLERGSATRSAGETLMHWLFPLHSGTAFGAPGRIAMFIAGITPALLVLTGLWVWWRKRRAEAFQRDRRGSSGGPGRSIASNVTTSNGGMP